MKTLVTGGGGFLGTRVAQMLQARGDEVTVLGRNAYPHHEAAGVPTIQADVRDAGAVADACADMDVVFHVAALAGIWGKKKAFWGINVGGTENVIAGCRAHQVRRLVFTSSPSVVFGEDDLRGVDESQPYPRRYLAHYAETKAVAERLALAANGPDLATVALRPHLIWGPGDPHLIPRVIARARQGRLIQVGDGTNLVDITYIDNAAEAHLQAADALAPGSTCAGLAYFVSQGEPVALWPWLNDVLEAVGIQRVTRSISHRTAYRIGAVLEAVFGLFGMSGEPRMTRFLATQLAHNHYFDISAARRDLAYEPRVSVQEGMNHLIEWLRASREGPSAGAAAA
jgi:nucleoside-diphosphate-sugar epimerase